MEHPSISQQGRGSKAANPRCLQANLLCNVVQHFHFQTIPEQPWWNKSAQFSKRGFVIFPSFT